MLLSVNLILKTSDLVTRLVQLGDLGLLDDLNSLLLSLVELFETLHEGIGDGHSWELGIVATVGTGLGVTTQSRDKGKVELEDVLEPFNRSCVRATELAHGIGWREASIGAIWWGRGVLTGRLVSKNLDQVRSGLVSGRLDCIIVELLNGVLDAEVNLGVCEGAVDSRSGLCRVSAEETYMSDTGG